MTSSDLRSLLAALPLLVAAACGGHGSTPAETLPNVVPVTVNGAGCSGAYLNKPCVSVTVCVPGTTTCQVIGDLLLDTGSVGLRIFKDLLPAALPAVTVSVPAGGHLPVAECVSYLDGSSHWGPVVQADVILGGEPAVRIPIQAIDSTYAAVPSACGTPDASPAAAGFNGILGVDVWEQDCGPQCVSSTVNPWYYACEQTGAPATSSCTGTTVAATSQVTNPVAAQATDNNGLLVHLPAVPASGAVSVEGQLILGIGTRSNNAPPAAVKGYPLDGYGEFLTTLGGVTVTAFVDTGSNGLFFAPPSASTLPDCADAPDWFCPASTVSLTATNAGAGGHPSGPVTFQIASYDALPPTSWVSSQIGGSEASGSAFDWGLPFHLGRDVYLGIEGRPSSLATGAITGPFVAY